MKHEIIEFNDVQIIGMSKKIAFNNPSEYSKFWGEYVERIVKPVFLEGKEPDEFQKAAVENGVGEFSSLSGTVGQISILQTISAE